jgi:hypothetical protein
MMDSAAAPALAAAPIVLEDAAVDLPLPGKAESAHPAPPRKAVWPGAPRGSSILLCQGGIRQPLPRDLMRGADWL